MTGEQAKETLIAYWLESADESLESARSEAQAGRGRFAMNRAYYACFYAACAVLLHEGRKFVKHAGVREAVHRDLIKTGRVNREFGQTYDRLFTARHQADYGEIVHFDDAKVRSEIEQAERFAAEMRRLIQEGR